MDEFDWFKSDKQDSNVDQGKKSGSFRRAGATEPEMPRRGVSDKEVLDIEERTRTKELGLIADLLEKRGSMAFEVIGNPPVVELIHRELGGRVPFSHIEPRLKELVEEEKRKNRERKMAS